MKKITQEDIEKLKDKDLQEFFYKGVINDHEKAFFFLYNKINEIIDHINNPPSTKGKGLK